MSKIATATLIVLCLITAVGCWLIFGIEYQRQTRELREIQAGEQAALDSEMYQAWHYASRYETFGRPLEEFLRTTNTNAKGPEKAYTLIDAEVLWVKVFQRSDVRFVGKSRTYGNGSYAVTVSVGWEVGPPKFTEFSLTAQCTLEKLDGPGDWAVGDWKFSPTGPCRPACPTDYKWAGDLPAETVKVRSR
jgi:hypothetical protein